jgi:RNA polymerase sigma-70 factor (ECF subfamily)
MLFTELILLFAMSAPMPDDEGAELAARIRDGDQQAFRSFFELHQHALMRFLLSRRVNREQAEDLIQQAFLTIWDKRAQIDTSKSLRSFLFTVAYNSMLNRIRDNREEVAGSTGRLPEESDFHTPEDDAMNSEAMKAMHGRLAVMPEKRRAVFELCYLQELSHREVAEIMDISTKTIENHMSIALRELREALKRYMG